MTQHSNTNISYIFEGMPVDGKHMDNAPYKVTIDSWEKKKLAKLIKTGQFVYQVPDMWPEKCWGYPQREPGYDIVCKVEKIEKVTEVKTWTHEDINLKDLARNLQ